MGKTMAEVIHEASGKLVDGGRMVHLAPADIARIAATLTAAGCGLVADAKREAWAEGYSAGFWDAKGSSEYRSIASNPYRKASNDDQ